MPETYTLSNCEGLGNDSRWGSWKTRGLKVYVGKLGVRKNCSRFWQLQKIKILFNVAIDDIKFLPKTSV